MYSCVMGLTGDGSEGCILADEMGLGKTLSAIALVYTMLSKHLASGEHHREADKRRTITFQKGYRMVRYLVDQSHRRNAYS